MWGRQRKLWSVLRCVMQWVTCAWHYDLGIYTHTMPCVFEQNRKRHLCLVHSPPQTHIAFNTCFWLSNDDHQSADREFILLFLNECLYLIKSSSIAYGYLGEHTPSSSQTHTHINVANIDTSKSTRNKLWHTYSDIL